MRKTVICLAIAAIGLSACSSRLNPMNWFGGSEEVAVETTTADVNPLIPKRAGLLSRPEEVYAGIPVQKITEMKVERTANGAIIRAAGIAYVQGAFAVALIPQNDGKPVSGVLSFELQAVHPKAGSRGGAEQTRQVTAAIALTNQELQGVRTIKVIGGENARQSRR